MNQKLPEPVPEMAQLSWFLGAWDVVSRSRNGEGEWKEELVRAEHKLILGGHVILEHFVGPLFGGPFEAWSLRKFNPASAKWEQRWVDTSPGGFADWTGEWSEATREFIGNPNRVIETDGSLAREAAREVFFEIGEEKFSWKYERTEDGGASWDPVWTLDYNKAVTGDAS